MRNARQSEAASEAASVFEQGIDVCGHYVHVYRRYLRGPGGDNRLLEVPIHKYAMRGSPRPHPTLLVSSNRTWTYAVTMYMSIIGISEGL